MLAMPTLYLFVFGANALAEAAATPGPPVATVCKRHAWAAVRSEEAWTGADGGVDGGSMSMVQLAVGQRRHGSPFDNGRMLWCGLARKEAKLDCNTVSKYALHVLKYPESWKKCVDKIRKKVGSAKTHQYNFQGNIEDGQNGETLHNGTLRNNSRRQWVLKFAKKTFVDSDYLYLRDSQHGAYGLWDQTGNIHPEKIPCGGDAGTKFLDETYYEVMAQSNFTLCPGGDSDFSFRFFEAILAGSIPVIDSVSDDLGGSLNGVNYTFFMTDEVANMKMSPVELKRIADANYEKLIKYNTFILGDHVPPSELPSLQMPCSSDPQCLATCRSMPADHLNIP